MARRARIERFPYPATEVVECVDGTPVASTTLRPISGPLHRTLAGLLRWQRKDRYLLDARSATPAMLAGRDAMPLLELDTDGRPILEVAPGMQGELRVGVSEMRVEQILADPSLGDPTTGAARIPLANGTRVRIVCGRKTFHARVGGPPIVSAVPAVDPVSAREPAASSSSSQFVPDGA